MGEGGDRVNCKIKFSLMLSQTVIACNIFESAVNIIRRRIPFFLSCLMGSM